MVLVGTEVSVYMQEHTGQTVVHVQEVRQMPESIHSYEEAQDSGTDLWTERCERRLGRAA